MGTDIKQLLPSAIYQALVNANAPSNTNPFATITDVVGQFANVLYVEKVPIAGQYGTVEAALAAITTNSPTNQFIIKIGVGIFTENVLNVKPYVSIIGSSIQETIIKPAGNHHIFVVTGIMTELLFMSLQSTQPGYAAIFCDDSGDYFQVHKLNFVDCDINIYIRSLTQDTFFYGEYIDFNGVYSIGLKVEANGGFRAFANVENYYNIPVGVSIIGTYVTGVGADVHIITSGQIGDSGLGTAFYLQDGANIEIAASDVNSFDKGLHIGNVGAICQVLIDSVIMQNNTTWDIQIERPGTTGTISGAYDTSKVYIEPTSTIGLLLQDTIDGSLQISKSLNVRFNSGVITDVSTLIIEGSTMGIMEGGDLSDGGGFNINVALGFGYYEEFPDNDVIRRLDWNNTSITLGANQDVFIYFNNSGLLVANGALPDTIYNILLGRVVTNGTGIEFIDASFLNAEHSSNRIIHNLREGIGSIYASGSTVTENATPLHLDVTSGEYYYGENEFKPSGGTDITFTRIYGQGSGVVTGQTSVDNTQYDNAGVLTAITAGYYTKASLYLVGEGVNEKYYYVYATAEYSTLLSVQQANTPLPPNTFSGSVVLIAGIIIQQGVANIVEIKDQRPIIGFRAFGITASADHLSLLNLNGGAFGDGGHSNLLTVNGSKTMTGNLDLGLNNIINVGTVNGVTIEAHASRHLPTGADPLTTAAPTSNLGGSSTNAVGIQNSFSRSDHSHAIDIASTSVTGLLTSTDWNTFNNKLSTVDNGLTATLGNVQWGGALIQDTYIDGAFGIWNGFNTPLNEYYIITGGPTQFGNVTVTGSGINLVGQDTAVGLARLDIASLGAFGPSAELRVQDLLNTVYSSVSLSTAGIIEITSTTSIALSAPTITLSQPGVNKILYTGIGGVLTAVTIGSGLSFAGGTLSSTTTGTIKGTIPTQQSASALNQLIPFGSGVLDTVTTNDNYYFKPSTTQLFLGNNFTPVYAGDINIMKSGVAVLSILNIQNIGTGNSASGVQFVQSANNYAQWVRLNSTNTANYLSTSLPQANTFLGSNTITGATTDGTAPMVYLGSIHYHLTGVTTTNRAIRTDTIGMRIGLMSEIHNANTVAFQVGHNALPVLQVVSNATTTNNGVFITNIASGQYGLNIGTASAGTTASNGININTLEQGMLVTSGWSPTVAGWVPLGIFSVGATTSPSLFQSDCANLASTIWNALDFNHNNAVTMPANSGIGIRFRNQANIGGKIEHYYNVTASDTTIAISTRKAAGLATRNFFFQADRFGVGSAITTPTAFVDIAASVAANASLRMRAGVTPTTPNDGDHWFDGNKFSAYRTVQYNLVGCVFANSVASNTITGVTLTDFNTNFTFPANSLNTVGKHIRIKAKGIFSLLAAGQTLTLALRKGATTLLTTGARVMQAAAANNGWCLEAEFYVVSTGAAGTIRSDMSTLFAETVFADGSVIGSNGTQAFDTTVSNLITISANFGGASASNTITIESMTYEVLN
jgi:hypothetical protein